MSVVDQYGAEDDRCIRLVGCSSGKRDDPEALPTDALFGPDAVGGS
ncbi:hypothetical protein [Gordonia malaquae]